MSAKKDFFISYTGKDVSWATWIARTLEDAGYTTIIQAWDFNVGDNFVDKMDYALKNTERFLAVLSEKYLVSPYCKVEWKAAFAKDIHLEKAVFIPVRIEKVIPSGIFTDVVYIDLCGLDEDASTTKLLNGVDFKGAKNLKGGAGTRKARFPGDMPLNNLPHMRNPYFTGRVEKLDAIHSNFQSNDGVSFSQSLTGLGGVGKTAIALEYAFRYSHEYETIWWVNAETPVSAFDAYKDFALHKKLTTSDDVSADEIIDAMKQWFKNNDKWLFIFDNADSDDYDKWLESYIPQSNTGNVLITTRSSNFPRSRSIDIIVFNETEALAYLADGTQKTGEAYSDELAKTLAKRLQYLPLALEQAAAYIRETPNVTYQDYINLLEEHGVEAFVQDNYLTDYSSIINMTWNISMQKITNKGALQMFNMCAYFASDRIPVNMFVRGSEALPDPLQSKIVDDLQRNSILRDLTRYSLLKPGINNSTSPGEKRVLDMHRLLQEVVQKSFGSDTVWLGHDLDLTYNILGWDEHSKESVDSFKLEAPHITAVAERSSVAFADDDDKINNVAAIFFTSSFLYTKLSFLDLSLSSINRSIEIMEQICSEEQQEDDTNIMANNLVTAYANKGAMCGRMAAYDKAIENYNKGINLGERLRTEGKLIMLVGLAKNYANRGISYNNLKNYEKALSDKNTSIIIIEELYNEGKLEDENELASVYLNRGATYESLTRYDESLADCNKSIAIWERMKKEGKTINENEYALAYQFKAVVSSKVVAEKNNVLSKGGGSSLRKNLAQAMQKKQTDGGKM
jgi:tetratricopeptide (TPR) repeat protein